MTPPYCFQILLVLVLAAPAVAQPEPTANSCDIVVYGGTSAGITAAIQARRSGKTVVLLEPSQHLGGLTTGGLGATDIGNKQVIGGLAREFYHQIRLHYRQGNAWVQEKADDYHRRYPRYSLVSDTMWTFEPHVASDVFRTMLEKAGVKPLLGQRLDRQQGVKMTDGRIVSIELESGKIFAGKMFIDATYEGDLMAAAGVSYHVGREANEVYGETLNGCEPQFAKSHQFSHKVDPYIDPGVPASGLVWGIQRDDVPSNGSGDKSVQAYCYRLCTTDIANNRRPWPKPADYDEFRYELLLRSFEAGDRRVPWNPVFMPNRKTDTNNNYAMSTDYIGGNFDYPEADYATREQILTDHRNYQQGLLWTLANHQRVPKSIQEHFQRFGLARDEFVDNDHWPTQLYVREARRMISDYVMTEQNCRGERLAEDSVGMGAYGMDSHNCLRHVSAEGFVRNEGDIQVHGFKPYPISYRSIVPRKAECTNLFAPVCVSSSHIGFGSIRMEPVFMVLGQSAAMAAAQAIEKGVSVQAIDYSRLAKTLRAAGQVLTLDDKPPTFK